MAIHWKRLRGSDGSDTYVSDDGRFTIRRAQHVCAFGRKTLGFALYEGKKRKPTCVYGDLGNTKHSAVLITAGAVNPNRFKIRPR